MPHRDIFTRIEGKQKDRTDVLSVLDENIEGDLLYLLDRNFLMGDP